MKKVCDGVDDDDDDDEDDNVFVCIFVRQFPVFF
jgi:hypothetical protein